MNAKKESIGREEALALARACDEVIVTKGKKVVRFRPKKVGVDDETLAGAILGRSGTLRAPVLQVGKKLYVGYDEDAYSELIG